jgi:hypothetical protein
VFYFPPVAYSPGSFCVYNLDAFSTHVEYDVVDII